jgi:hypothetical protein
VNWEAFKSFFTSKLVLQLRADLEEARHERDYFRGKVDRLEMVLMRLPEPVSRPRTVPANVEPVGRKSWAQVQEEWLEKQQEALKSKSKMVPGPPGINGTIGLSVSKES